MHLAALRATLKVSFAAVAGLATSGLSRYCSPRMARRDPAIGLIAALVFAWAVLHFGFSLLMLKFCIFFALLISLAVTDLETRLLPDRLTIGGLAIGLMLSFFISLPNELLDVIAHPFGVELHDRLGSVARAVVAALIPAAFLWCARWLFEQFRGTEGLGLGDVKMIAMVGAFVGLPGALVSLTMASLIGSIVGIGLVLCKGKGHSTDSLPFGSFLSAAVLLVTVLSPQSLGF
jgi:leader peptidase (prepilin peptidase)/N-methyltransferase